MEMMKKTARLFVIALAGLLMMSCNKHENRPAIVGYDATVTFRPLEDGSYYLKQDDSTALVVLNEGLKKYPFKDGREKRGLVSYILDKDNQANVVVPGYKYAYQVTLTAMDTIYTKNPVRYFEKDENKYGKDPLGLFITRDVFPTTMIEDGYLNVCFSIPVGISGIVHSINLLTGVNPDDPYEVELRHNAQGDVMQTDRAFVTAFPLKDLPDTEGKTVTLTLKWNSIVSGREEKVTFPYRTRTDW